LFISTSAIFFGKYGTEYKSALLNASTRRLFQEEERQKGRQASKG